MTCSTFADVLGRELAAVHYGPLFGLAGSGNLRLAAAFSGAGGQFVSTCHENAAVAMADGWAQAAGSVGAATVHQGPGLTNAVTALIDAAKGRVPVVVIAAACASVDAHQFIDQPRLLSGAGAGIRSWLVDRPEPELMARALLAARREQCCIVLHIPTDVFDMQVSASAEQRPTPQLAFAEVPTALAEDQAVDVAKRLLAADRPTVVAGRGAVLAGAEGPLRAVAEATGACLVTTAGARGMFTGHPAYRGMIGGLGAQPAIDAMLGADLLLAFGSSWDDWSTCGGSAVGDATEVVRINLARSYPADEGTLIADARTAAKQVELLLLSTRPAHRTPRHAWLPAADSSAAGMWPERSGVVHPAALCRELDQILPPDRTVVFDSGQFMAFVARYVDVASPGAYVFGQAFQSVGLGLARGIGASLARSGRPTIAFCGDGGALMAAGELETMARVRAPLLVVCMNDSAFGAEVHDFAPLGVDVSLVRFPQRDLAAAARALGVQAAVITSVHDLAVPVGAWLTSGADGTFFLDCRVDPKISATSILTTIGAREWSGH